MSAGVVTAQGPGVPVEFIIVRGDHAKLILPMASTATPGTLLKYNPGGTPPGVDIAGSSDTVLAGILQETTIDISSLPAYIQTIVWAIGALEARNINEPVTVWDSGIFKLINVHSTIAEGDQCRGYTGGLVQSTTSTNDLTNGSIVCTVGNGAVSGGPVTVSVALS